jgi:hypothetical protein
MVEQDQLELEPSRFKNLRGAGGNLHSFFSRGKTRREEFGFPLLLNQADTAGAEGNKPAIVAEGGNPEADGLGSLQNGLPFLHLRFDSVNPQFNGLIRHYLPSRKNETIEYWNAGSKFEVSLLFFAQYSILSLYSIQWP